MDSTHLYTQRAKTPAQIMRDDAFWVTPSQPSQAVQRQDAPRGNATPKRLLCFALAGLLVALAVAAVADPVVGAALRNAVHIDCMGVPGC